MSPLRKGGGGDRVGKGGEKLSQSKVVKFMFLKFSAFNTFCVNSFQSQEGLR